ANVVQWFTSVDPLAGQFVGWTPYHYVHQNPINLIDPTGMSAENGDGGGWISRTWNKAKSLFSSSQESPATLSPIEHTELDEVTVDANKKPNWVQRNFSKDKLANDWKNIKENSGWNHFVNYKFKGYGSIIHSGQGSENGAGWDDYEGQPHTLKSTDVSSYSFSDPRIIQFVTEGYSKWYSIKGDENIQEGIKYIKKTLYNGVNDSLPIDLTPKQNDLFNDYDTSEGQGFRDSLRREYYFNTSK